MGIKISAWLCCCRINVIIYIKHLVPGTVWCSQNNCPELGALLPKGNTLWYLFSLSPAPESETPFLSPPVLLRTCFSIQIYLQPLRTNQKYPSTVTPWAQKRSQKGGSASLTTRGRCGEGSPRHSRPCSRFRFSKPQLFSLPYVTGSYRTRGPAGPVEPRIHGEAPSLSVSPEERRLRWGPCCKMLLERLENQAPARESWLLSLPPVFPSLSSFPHSSLHQPALSLTYPTRPAPSSFVCPCHCLPPPSALSFIAA